MESYENQIEMLEKYKRLFDDDFHPPSHCLAELYSVYLNDYADILIPHIIGWAHMLELINTNEVAYFTTHLQEALITIRTRLWALVEA